MNPPRLTILPKPLIAITLAFMLSTVIGTVSHEFGHLLTARALGYTPVLHFAEVEYGSSALTDELEKVYESFSDQIKANEDFPGKEAYEKNRERFMSEMVWVTLGGPIQTCLTGTIGLLLLLWRRKSWKNGKLSLTDWLGVFLSLFWLREVFNLLTGFISELLSPNGYYFGGDEYVATLYLDLAPGLIAIPLALTGAAVSVFIVFRVIPPRLRPTFIISGFVGAALGFAGWMYWLGPIVLP